MSYQDVIKKINAMGLFELREYALKLARENKGLKSRIDNLEEKLYKRNESFKGEVNCDDKRKRGI